jgi:DNA-binding NtrC family response regulator
MIMTASPSVLVVDDDEDIVANIVDILQDRGFRTDRAHCGAEAMQLVRRNNYDMTLLDFQMPDMDGATLFSRIKRVQPEIVAIMITAYAGSDGVQRAGKAGAWRVLRKPVDIPHMLSCIDEALHAGPMDQPAE